jgi:hypothetical protein
LGAHWELDENRLKTFENRLGTTKIQQPPITPKRRKNWVYWVNRAHFLEEFLSQTCGCVLGWDVGWMVGMWIGKKHFFIAIPVP